MEGYKVFEPDWTCRGFQYEVGKTFEEDVTPSCCNRGFHFCKELKDCFNYYPFNPDNKVAKVIALGEIDEESDDSKCCTNKIQIVEEISWEDVLRMVNLGKGNAGLCNSGDRNSGNRNSGDWNSGDWNSGNCNSGDRNSGKNTAKRVWRWNLNGLGYSKTGYKGSYELAMTMDGQILGTLIAGEAIKAEHISTEYKTSVERQISNAKKDVENDVQEELKSYWTKTEVETAINQSANSIKLSAKETASGLISEALKSYSTSAQIEVTTNAISSEVKKKVGYSEVISSINQSAESVAIKASKIKLEGLVTANKNFQVLTDGSIIAKNGTFTGNITGSKITGSTVNITDSKGCKIDLDASGLRIEANKYTDIFGHQGGKLVIGTTASILESMFSPICFYPADGGVWNLPVASGCNKFRFVWNVMSSCYVEIQTLYGAYGLTAWASDKKLKKNIIDSEISGIDEIMKIPHYSFDWKNKDYHVDCGYIAQEMEKLNQSYVIKIAQHDEKGKYTGDSYQIDETAIIPVITKALQEVIERLERVEEK